MLLILLNYILITRILKNFNIKIVCLDSKYLYYVLNYINNKSNNF